MSLSPCLYFVFQFNFRMIQKSENNLFIIFPVLYSAASCLKIKSSCKTVEGFMTGKLEEVEDKYSWKVACYPNSIVGTFLSLFTNLCKIPKFWVCEPWKYFYFL